MSAKSFFVGRKTILGFSAAVVLIGFGYFSVFHYAEIPREILQHFGAAERIEFCTVQPIPASEHPPVDYGYGDLEGHSIVDRVFLKNHRSVISAISWSDRMNNSTAAACFNPRHAIRDSEDQDNYLLICFECMQLNYRFQGESGSAKISKSQLSFFQELIEIHSMTRACDLRTD